jgi:hypothetical protein
MTSPDLILKYDAVRSDMIDPDRSWIDPIGYEYSESPTPDQQDKNMESPAAGRF